MWSMAGPSGRRRSSGVRRLARAASCVALLLLAASSVVAVDYTCYSRFFPLPRCAPVGELAAAVTVARRRRLLPPGY